MHIPSRPSRNAHLHLKTTVLKLRIHSWKREDQWCKEVWNSEEWSRSFTAWELGFRNTGCLWKALGLGTSQGRSTFPTLRNMHEQLCVVARAWSHQDSALNGQSIRKPLSLSSRSVREGWGNWPNLFHKKMVLNRGSHTTCLTDTKGTKTWAMRRKPASVYKARGDRWAPRRQPSLTLCFPSFRGLVWWH